MSKLRSVLKWLLLALAVLVVTWVIVGAWWQTTHRVVTVDDALVYLGVLPTVLIALVAFGSWIRQKKRAAPDEQAAQSGTVDIPASTPVQHPAVAILSAWAVSPAGTTVDEYLETLSSRNTRPSPDKALTDNQGFPVLTGRVNDLDTSLVLEWLEKKDPMPAHAEWRDAFLRALALLDRLLEQVVDEWTLPLAGSRQDAGLHMAISTLRGTPVAMEGNDERKLALQIQLLLPLHFQDEERLLAERFLSERIATLSLADSPCHIDTIGAADDASAFSLADRFRVKTVQTPHPQALLILAADSSLCPSIMDAWSADDRLFIGGKHPNGFMPGEGAFGILYANGAALAFAEVEPLCLQTPTIFARRKISADEKQRPSHDCMAKIVNEALAQAGVSGDSIAAVACDADHRTSRALECAGTMLNETPHLDAIQHRLATNETCGHLGTASALGALVAGVAQAMTAAPLLIAHVNHPTERAATLLLPPTGTAAT
jgi:hypothetical protein